MSRVTISLPDRLNAQVEQRAKSEGFASKEDYLLNLVQMDCEQTQFESILSARDEGPFAPLEDDWQERVRTSAKRRA